MRKFLSTFDLKLTLANKACVAFMLLLSCGANATAQELTYLYYPYPPYGMERNGALTGYMTDIMQTALKRTGLPSRTIEASVVRAITDAQAKADHFTAATDTTEMRRRRDLRWAFCFETVTHSLIVKKSTGYASIEAIPRHAVIGAFVNYTLRDYLAEQGFTKLHYVRENSLLANLIERDRIDAWASFGAAAKFILKERGVDLNEIVALPIKDFPFCAVTSKETSDTVVMQVRDAYRRMVQDGTRKSIRDAYAPYLEIDAPPPLPDLASAEDWGR